MKKFIISLLVSLVPFISFAQNKVKEYQMSGFTGIKATHQYKINVKKGNSKTIKVEYPLELETYISVMQEKDIVVFSFNKSFTQKVASTFDSKEKAKANQIVVTLEMPELNYVELEGSCSLNMEGHFQTSVFSCALSGACDANLSVWASTLRGSVSSSAKLFAEGSWENIDFEKSGSSKLKISGDCNGLLLKASGSGDFNFDGEIDDHAKVEAGGSSNNYFKGECKYLVINATKTALVDAQKLNATSAEVSARGFSKVHVRASKDLSLDAGMTAKIHYYGDPKNLYLEGNGTRYEAEGDKK